MTEQIEPRERLVQVRFKPNDLRLLDELAVRLGSTRSSVIRVAVRTLDDQVSVAAPARTKQAA